MDIVGDSTLQGERSSPPPATDGPVERLNPSKLGTQKYWDDFYSVEKTNFENNDQDTGECWFADSCAEEKVVDFLVQLAEDEELPEIVDIRTSTILDLGTGNGRLLFSVREAGFENKLTGLDYSAQAVEFSRKIAETENIKEVEFRHADFLENDDWNPEKQLWDVVLDKGTLDAIALGTKMYGADEDEGKGRTGVQQYALRVPEFVKPGGMVLITSCNFTEAELISCMTASGQLTAWKSIEYPTFEFGGAKGQTVCSIAFLKG